MAAGVVVAAAGRRWSTRRSYLGLARVAGGARRPAVSHRTAHVACAVVARRERVTLHDATRLQRERPARNAHSARTWRAARTLARAARALLSVDSVRRHAAARNGLAAIMAALLLQAASALADGAPNLILPLVTAIAFASAASDVPRQVTTLDPGGRPLLSLIPKQVQIVDGYQYDFEDYVGLKRPSDMVDSDRIVSYDILRQPRRGWMASVAYDEEYRGPVTGHSDVLRIELKHRF